IDITQRGYDKGTFGSSPAFQWLAADNYYNDKRFGFNPSYPPDATRQGPNPVPWEYTWLGVETILCGLPSEDDGRFCDDDGSIFEADIEWLAAEGITTGCNPPENDRFCPNQPVTRGQMAAFLVRALGLTDRGGGDLFSDDDGSTFEADIDRLGAGGVTRGCNPPDNDRFCPDRPVTRGQLAVFMVRGLELPPGDGNPFSDDDGSPFEDDIEALAAAGITKGCGEGAFCPDAYVTRGEMAAFLHRALNGQ
ncbi:MAG: S-layer homology domain-containing protein, partial [Acidimicrobiia bacterium]|nr:S-layer homology domain-containing protein [Acidimicrobiia bacterium]